MIDAAAFKASYSDWRLIKGRKVVQVCFEIPLELADGAYQALGGMPNPAESVWCAIARLNPENVKEAVSNESPHEIRRTETSPASEAISARAKKLTQRIAITCNDPLFARYLSEKKLIHGLETCAAAVRRICSVESRRDILPNTSAGLAWDLLESGYVCWRDVPELADA